jgi:hypothetical protein
MTIYDYLTKLGVRILTENHVSTELLTRKQQHCPELVRYRQFRENLCNMGYHCLPRDNGFLSYFLEF